MRGSSILGLTLSRGAKPSPARPSPSPNRHPLLAISFRERRARPGLSPPSYGVPLHSFPTPLLRRWRSLSLAASSFRRWFSRCRCSLSNASAALRAAVSSVVRGTWSFGFAKVFFGLGLRPSPAKTVGRSACSLNGPSDPAGTLENDARFRHSRSNNLGVAALLGDTLIEKIAPRALGFQGRLHRRRRDRQVVKREVWYVFSFRGMSTRANKLIDQSATIGGAHHQTPSV